MSFFDQFKKKAGEAADQHGDKIAQGLDRASGAVSKATHGKYDDRLGKGVGKAKESLARHRKGGGPTDGTAGR